MAAWTNTEQLELVRAWINVKEIPSTNRRAFWQDVLVEFNQITGTNHRNVDQINSKWHSIQNYVNRWHGVYSATMQAHPGVSEQMAIQLTHDAYRQQYDSDFSITNLLSWSLMRFHYV